MTSLQQEVHHDLPRNLTTPATIQIEVGGLIFEVLQNNIGEFSSTIGDHTIENEDFSHFITIQNETLENMKYIRNSIRLISSDDLSMYKNCIDWYFYILDYGHTNKYNDYIIFLDLNEYYMNEIKKRMEEVKEITITTNPDEFKIIDQIFLDMQDTLNHLKDQDRIRFDIGEMMKWIHEFVENYFSPY
jgi:hypothetical protein